MEKEPTLAQKLVAEFVGTGLLVLIGAGSVQAAVKLDGGSGAKFSMADLGSAVDRRAPIGWAALTIGAIVAGVVIALGPASGQGINPARYFGSYINQWWFGGPLHREQILVYTTAPVVGSVIATLLHDFLNGKEAAPQPEPEQVREVVSRETIGVPAQ